MPRPHLWFLAVLPAALGLWWACTWMTDELDPDTDVEHIGRFPASQFFLEHDLFLPATDPQTVPAGRAGYLRGDDEVFGVVLGDGARAYPIHMISYHHVVNDVVRGIPVAITY